MARSLPHSSHPLLRIKLPPHRSRVVLLTVALAFLALAVRAMWLQVMTNDFLQKEGEKRYEIDVDVPALRGDITDRNGQVLASSLPASSVAVFPDRFEASDSQVQALAKLLQMPEKELRRKVADETRNFVYLKRQVDMDVAGQVAAMKIPGLYQSREYKRHYSEGDTMAQVVGFTNIEDRGQEGVELSKQSLLAGQTGHRKVIRDRMGRIIEEVEVLRAPRDGRNVQLSVDKNIQYIAFNAVRDAVRAHRAQAGSALVMDVKTGEILALANWPTYDPNQRSKMSGAQLRNRALTDTYEPGSTMKPFTVALALEMNKVRPDTVIQTAPGRMTIGTATIGDSHAMGALTVEQVIQKSSNIGTSKIALSMAPHDMWELFVQLGFGQAPQLGFPGAVAGRVRPYKTWKPIEQATMSYGHGISVSLLQMVRAYSVFARDGDLVTPTMYHVEGPVNTVQVIRPEAARAMRKMLEMVVSNQGTAPQAQIPGYRAAGKTGTSLKQENGHYVKKYVASFVGFAPVSNPRFVIGVMIDEPRAGGYYAGEVAAPVFSKIAERSLLHLRVPPDSPVASLVIPPKSALVEESL